MVLSSQAVLSLLPPPRSPPALPILLPYSRASSTSSGERRAHGASACVHWFFHRGRHQFLPRGLRISRSPCLKRVLSRVPPRTQSRGCYSAAVLLVPMFSQSAMQRWLGGRRTVQRCQAREETTTKATTKKITSGVVVMRRRRHLLCRLDDGTGRSMARHWGMRSGRTPCLNVWALAMECSSRTTAR